MDFLVATDMGRFRPKLAQEPQHEEQSQGTRCLDRGRSVCCFVNLSGLSVCFLVSLSVSLIVCT